MRRDVRAGEVSVGDNLLLMFLAVRGEADGSGVG
jgi:hypothetical protein